MTKRRVNIEPGYRKGRLVVIREVSLLNKKGYHRRALQCKCDCGATTTVRLENFRRKSNSCGCLNLEVLKKRAIHGYNRKGVRNRTYSTWASMLSRCTNKHLKCYHRYGGRGISFSERWARFENFLADMGERPTGRELDRIDNNKDYTKENCRWVTRSQNCRNKSNNRRLYYGGKEQTLTDWSEELKISRQAVVDRLRRGWSVDRALSVPVRKINV